MPSLTAFSPRALSATSGPGFATPVMGYNTYNEVACSPTADGLSATIDALVSRGFKDAGYNFFQIDCGWQSRNGTRGKTNPFNAIDYDTINFPNGVGPISDKARKNGLIFSLYSDAGYKACDTIVPSPRLGSYGYEEADAKLFASLNVDYLKYDYCYADGSDAGQNAPKDPRKDYVDRYTAMWNALNNNQIERMLICQWGTPYVSPNGGALEGPVDWTKGISTSFRLSDDIYKDWNAVTRIINQSIYVAKTGKTGPGHFADADLLEVGVADSKLSFDQQATHFAYWTMAKSALVISANVGALDAKTVGVLQNKDLIAINQDSLGKPVVLVQRWTNDRDLYSGPLANGDEAVLLINWRSSARSDLTVDLAQLGIAKADVKNLWTGATKTGVSGKYSVGSVAGYGSAPLRLSNVQRSNPSSPVVNWVEAESGSVGGGATTASCSGCSGSKKVGNLASAASVTFNNVAAKASTSTLLFDYVNADIGYLGGTNQNFRTARISVNDGPAVDVSFPISGYNWDADVSKNYRVELSGFKAGSSNKVTVKGPASGYAPDFDRIGVIQQ